MMLAIYDDLTFKDCTGPRAPDGTCAAYYRDGDDVLKLFQFNQPLALIVGLQIIVFVILKIIAYLVLRGVAKRAM